MYKIEIIKEIEKIEEKWTFFEEVAMCYAFQSYNWINTWINTIGTSKDLLPQIVIVSNSKDEIVFILPLVIKRVFGIKLLTWINGDYKNGIFKTDFYNHFSQNDFNELWEKIKSKLSYYDLAFFSQQPEVILSIKNPFVFYLPNILSDSQSHQADIGVHWENYYNTIKKKIRLDTERQIRRLSNKGEISFVIATSKNELEKFTNKMIEQKETRYRSTKAHNMFKNNLFKNFYLSLLSKQNKFFNVHVAALKLNDQILAVHWGILYKKRFYYLMPANDWGEWQKYSPGKLLLTHLLKWCAENKIQIFDFTGGNENYKYDWTNAHMNLYNYIEPKTFLGFIVKYTVKFKQFLKRKV